MDWEPKDIHHFWSPRFTTSIWEKKILPHLVVEEAVGEAEAPWQLLYKVARPWANMSPLNSKVFSPQAMPQRGWPHLQNILMIFKIGFHVTSPPKKNGWENLTAFFLADRKMIQDDPKMISNLQGRVMLKLAQDFLCKLWLIASPATSDNHQYDEYGRMWFQDTPSDSVTLPKKQDVMPALKLMASGEMSIWHICPKRSSTNLHSICSWAAASTSGELEGQFCWKKRLECFKFG